jgi:riboflavin kinase/FMN adenylyltransferase
VIAARRLEELESITGPLAVTIGVFDGCHRGHEVVFDLLKAEARRENAFAAVVTFDPHPLEILRPGDAPALLTTLAERLYWFERSGIDGALVVPFSREIAALSAARFLDAVLPKRARFAVLTIGFDFRMGKDRAGGFEELQALGRERGFRVARAAPMSDAGEPVSSTRIRVLLREGKVVDAAELLGHRYLIQGDVVRGRGLGRTLGFPTANVDPGDPRKLLPRAGVYAVVVSIEGGSPSHPGVMNVGTRPTFGLTETVVEVHLHSYAGDLLGKRLGIELVERIRDERKFAGPEALKARIQEDVAVARRILEGAS